MVLDTTETYHVWGEEWKCKELILENMQIPVCTVTGIFSEKENYGLKE